MSYGERERSPNQGAPILLFAFEFDGRHIDYTDADDIVFFQRRPFQPIAIDHGEISQSGDLSKATLKVECSRDTDIVDLFKIYPPSSIVTLIIYEGHVTDTDDRQFLITFRGRVLNAEIGAARATLSCEPASTSLKRPALRRNYQRGCPLVLYGEKCKAVKTGVRLTVQKVTDNVIKALYPAGGMPAGFAAYETGTAIWSNTKNNQREVRAILQVTDLGASGEFKMSGPVFDSPGEIVVYKGCQHTEDSCINWHNNIQNFGGQPFIPYDNPVGTVSTYF